MTGRTNDGGKDHRRPRLPASGAVRGARLVAEALRQSLSQLLDEPRILAPRDRDATVAAIERALGRRRRRQGLRRHVAPVSTFAAAALVLIVAAGIVGRRAGERAPAAGGLAARDERAMTVLGALSADPTLGGTLVSPAVAGSRALARGMTLAPGDQLTASPSSEIRLGTLEGSVLTLERSSELAVVEESGVQRFALRSGAVRAQVARLVPGQRFVIDTGDAEIEVHGTVFRVAMAAGDGACASSGIRTRVSVTEGVVGVRVGDEQVLVKAGDAWPKDCSQSTAMATSTATATVTGTVTSTSAVPGSAPPMAPRAAASPTLNARTRAVARPGARRSSPIASTELTTTAAAAGALPGSSLAAQNDLFLAALRARREARPQESLRSLARLIDGYPDGPLTEAAMAERMELLRAAGDASAAARVAGQYLRRFPDGFARPDADRLVRSAP
jgi:hypothetical protein